MHKINVRKYNDKKIYDLHTIDLSDLKSPHTLDFVSSENLNLINKIEKQPLKLFNFCQCQSACATSDAYKLKPLVISLKNSDINENEYFKLVNTGTIGKYYSKPFHVRAALGGVVDFL